MEIVIYIYNGMTMLDAIGPYEVLRNVKGVTIKLVANRIYQFLGHLKNQLDDQH